MGKVNSLVSIHDFSKDPRVLSWQLIHRIMLFEDRWDSVFFAWIKSKYIYFHIQLMMHLFICDNFVNFYSSISLDEILFYRYTFIKIMYEVNRGKTPNP